MFRALLAHPQEALHKRHLVYCVRVMSVGCTRIGVVGVLRACYVSWLHQGWSFWCIACVLCHLAAPGLEFLVYCVRVMSVGCTRIGVVGVLRACYVSWLHQDWSCWCVA
jgi:hypothetical protein